MTIPQCSLSYWTSYCTGAMGSGANRTITTSIWWSLYCLVLLVLDQSASFLQINPGYVKTVSFLRVCWISLEWNSDWWQARRPSYCPANSQNESESAWHITGKHL